MAELVWSLRDTHCVWCGNRKATTEEWAVDHEGHSEFDADVDCWCLAVCWGTCRESVFDEGTVAGLRALVEAQASVIARYVDGRWHHTFGVEGEGEWVDRLRDTREPMLLAEQIVVYGEVVRSKEADTDGEA